MTESPAAKSRTELQLFFLGALIFGVGFMAIAQALSGSMLAVVLPPLMAMIGYGAIAFVRDRAVFASAPFADSLYYMGFLFTLIALLFSLYALGTQAEATDLKSVLAQFGVALTTTVVGLVARIVLVNFRTSLEEETQLSQNALIQETDQFRHQLEQSRVTLVAQMDVVHQTIATSLATATTEVESAMSGLAKATEDGASLLTKTLETSASQIEQESEKLARTLTSVGGEFKGTSNVVLDELRKHAQQLKAAHDGALDGLTSTANRFGAAVDSLDTVTKSYEAEASRLTTATASLDRSMTSLAQEVDKAEAEVASFTKQTAALTTSLTGATRQASDLSREFDQSKQPLANAVDALEKHQRTLADLVARLGQATTESEAATRKVHENLVKSATFIIDRLGGDGKDAEA